MHPGAILQDTQRRRRPKAEIDEEKESKRLEREAKVQKKADKEVRKTKGKALLAELNIIEDAAIANAKRISTSEAQERFVTT
jgi:hypothetical protein